MSENRYHKQKIKILLTLVYMAIFVHNVNINGKSLTVAIEIDLLCQSSQVITQITEFVAVFNTILHNMKIS